MKKFFIFVAWLALFVSTLEALKCHGLVRNYKNYTKFHTDTGEICSSLSNYCFSIDGRVNSVNNVYIAGCDELLKEADFVQLNLKCDNVSQISISTSSNKYGFKCCKDDMCNSGYIPKISLGFLCIVALSFIINFKFHLL
uniref:BAMBI domain-containing protein n=1 Tax=Strongyloides stercoralis TaxID=6248 RepID=A0A0K0EQ84_STRER